MAKQYQLYRKSLLPISVDEAWDFFSSPQNLKKITPSYLGFEITSGTPKKMYAGMFISYIVRPVLGIPLQWKTEITEVKDKEYFIDEQRVGPYKLWRHKHIFEATDSGVIMEDIVDYILPLGILGRLAHSLFVKKQLNDIFNYRATVTDELWH